jgi:hypothetical protein
VVVVVWCVGVVEVAGVDSRDLLKLSAGASLSPAESPLKPGGDKPAPRRPVSSDGNLSYSSVSTVAYTQLD